MEKATPAPDGEGLFYDVHRRILTGTPSSQHGESSGAEVHQCQRSLLHDRTTRASHSLSVAEVVTALVPSGGPGTPFLPGTNSMVRESVANSIYEPRCKYPHAAQALRRAELLQACRQRQASSGGCSDPDSSHGWRTLSYQLVAYA
jgi:hypothetical protein